MTFILNLFTNIRVLFLTFRYFTVRLYCYHYLFYTPKYYDQVAALKSGL